MAGAALLPGVLVLNLMIALQMLGAGMEQGDRSAGPRRQSLLQVNQRALTNTVEQLAGFVPALIALAAAAPPAWMPGVVALGVVFAVARLVFWGGYLIGPLLRAPGMAATVAVNVATFVTAVWVWWP